MTSAHLRPEPISIPPWLALETLIAAGGDALDDIEGTAAGIARPKATRKSADKAEGETPAAQPNRRGTRREDAPRRAAPKTPLTTPTLLIVALAAPSRGAGMPRPLIVAVCQQKGGVGKTAATTGIADAAAQLDKSVLVIDMDPQANATTNLGFDDTPPFTANDVLTVDAVTREVARGGILDAFVPAGEAWGSRIHVVASELALAAREQDQDLGREYRLRTALDDDAISQWDLIVIDCPPSLGQLTVNALAAADAALLITEPRAASVDGLAQMVRTLTTVRQHYNPQLRIAGIVINKYRPDRRDRVEWADQVRAIYGDLVIDPFLPEREIVAVAASACSPLSAYGAKSREITDVFAAIAQRLLATLAGAGA